MGIDDSFLQRGVNDGFSGGEKVYLIYKYVIFLYCFCCVLIYVNEIIIIENEII